ncbi:MAG: hypothetical protein WCB27_14850, partial [Thermoguttaceae bacterium]
ANLRTFREPLAPGHWDGWNPIPVRGDHTSAPRRGKTVHTYMFLVLTPPAAVDTIITPSCARTF